MGLKNIQTSRFGHGSKYLNVMIQRDDEKILKPDANSFLDALRFPSERVKVEMASTRSPLTFVCDEFSQNIINMSLNLTT